MSLRTLSLLALIACGGDVTTQTPVDEPTPEEMAAAEEEDNAAPAAEEEAKEESALKVVFVEPADGATVKSPVKIVMGVEGMEVQPAGEVTEGTGHHHLIIGPAGIPEGTQVPKDETHIHFGKGQTEAEVELEPGEHKLTLQFADGAHVSYGEAGSATITVTVEE